MKALKILFFTLMLIGALNWGLVGLFNIDLVAKLLGDMTILARLTYIIVALSGLFSAFILYPVLTEQD